MDNVCSPENSLKNPQNLKTSPPTPTPLQTWSEQNMFQIQISFYKEKSSGWLTLAACRL